MRRAFWVPPLLLLDALALHDILAGEPGAWMEWAVLGLSLAAYGLLLIIELQRRLIAHASERDKYWLWDRSAGDEALEPEKHRR
jgi:hypothetical protein